MRFGKYANNGSIAQIYCLVNMSYFWLIAAAICETYLLFLLHRYNTIILVLFVSFCYICHDKYFLPNYDSVHLLSTAWPRCQTKNSTERPSWQMKNINNKSTTGKNAQINVYLSIYLLQSDTIVLKCCTKVHA